MWTVLLTEVIPFGDDVLNNFVTNCIIKAVLYEKL